MFTGIVEEVARIAQIQAFRGGRRFRVEASCAGAVHPGDSVSLSGVCLTVETPRSGTGMAETRRSSTGMLTVSAVEETLRRTTAGRWRPGSRVHLERALQAAGRLGGHLVQGHVDAVARIVRAGREGREFVLCLRLPAAFRQYVVVKGSLAVDGVSLTVGALSGGLCRLYIIPETLERTLIGSYRPGGQVNLEVDVVAKYVESMMGMCRG